MNTLDVAAPALFGGIVPTTGDRGGAFTEDRRVDASDVLGGERSELPRAPGTRYKFLPGRPNRVEERAWTPKNST
jgi:hypothetical protein